jgi:hypothetical protein
MVLYDFDSNSILAERLCSRAATKILRAFRHLSDRLVARGLRPQLQRLDNEASTILKQYLVDEAIQFQLVPPHIHRRNAAERAIRTFKNYLISGLATPPTNDSPFTFGID